MQHFFTFLLLCSTCFNLSAQQVTSTTVQGKPGHAPQSSESTCNFAGTISFGQFIGQSNHVEPNQVFFCLGDSLLIKHNGDADLSGDPVPGTPPGVAMAFYACPPTISGDDLITISLTPGDPCLLGGAGTLLTTEGFPNGGESWFFNNGSLQDGYGLGQPIEVFFAPITLDDWVETYYESGGVGTFPGACVNVNINETFSVVYLNKIRASQVENMVAGNRCIGKFAVSGGFPQYDDTATYNIDISLDGHPEEKGILHLPPAQQFNQTFILFSVTTPGLYHVAIEDGKSCGLQLDIDMSGCDASTNVRFEPDTVSALPGDTVCVPVRVQGFEVVSAAFSIHWDASELQYLNYDDLHPAIASFFDPAVFLNPSQIPNGKLGFSLFDLSWPGTLIDVPDNEHLLSLCFQVIDTLDACTPVQVMSAPSILAFENEQGLPLAITTLPGAVCPGETQVSVHSPNTDALQVWPNPSTSGDKIRISGLDAQLRDLTMTLRNTSGKVIDQQPLYAGNGTAEYQSGHLPAGVYFLSISSETNPGVTVKLVVSE